MELETQVLTPGADARPALFGGGEALDPVAEILSEARARGASHVHFEPAGDWIRVRLRVGGRLSDVLRLPGAAPLALDGHGAEIAELDGRVVLHLAAAEARCGALESLGMPAALAQALTGLRDGLVLVAGPEHGATLAALRDQYDDGGRNLMAAASAVELRAVLRQDPDLILIESLADRELATLAVGAAEAGKLIFAGIGANDAVGAILALKAMRIGPFQIASTLRAAIAQRQVRRLCPECRVPVQASGSVSALLGFDAGTVVYAAGGCDRCGDGHAGEIGVFEAIMPDAAMRRLINDGGDGAIIARHAFLNSPSLGSAARTMAREGITTPEEALRISRT